MSQGPIDERMDYRMMEELSLLFRDAAQQIEEASSEMLKIATTIDNDALIGQAGDRFSQAIRVDLKNSLKKLQDKMLELSQDINGAVQFKRDAIADAKSRFK